MSQGRKKHYLKNINNHNYKVYPVYYPVGQGMRNIVLAKEDLIQIMKENDIDRW